MAAFDFLFRLRRQASAPAFNAALPANYKLLDVNNDPAPGIHIDRIDNLVLVPAVLDGDGNIITPAVISSDLHYNVRVTEQWSGWDGLFITDDQDPDFNDPRINKSKVKQWMKNNGVERTDTAGDHPRSGRTDMRWFRWINGTEWVDVTIDSPLLRRRVWL